MTISTKLIQAIDRLQDQERELKLIMRTGEATKAEKQALEELERFLEELFEKVGL